VRPRSRAHDLKLQCGAHRNLDGRAVDCPEFAQLCDRSAVEGPEFLVSLDGTASQKKRRRLFIRSRRQCKKWAIALATSASGTSTDCAARERRSSLLTCAGRTPSASTAGCRSPASLTSRPNAVARCVLPLPLGPTNRTFSRRVRCSGGTVWSSPRKVDTGLRVIRGVRPHSPRATRSPRSSVCGHGCATPRCRQFWQRFATSAARCRWAVSKHRGTRELRIPTQFLPSAATDTTLFLVNVAPTKAWPTGSSAVIPVLAMRTDSKAAERSFGGIAGP